MEGELAAMALKLDSLQSDWEAVRDQPRSSRRSAADEEPVPVPPFTMGSPTKAAAARNDPVASALSEFQACKGSGSGQLSAAADSGLRSTTDTTGGSQHRLDVACARTEIAGPTASEDSGATLALLADEGSFPGWAALVSEEGEDTPSLPPLPRGPVPLSAVSLSTHGSGSSLKALAERRDSPVPPSTSMSFPRVRTPASALLPTPKLFQFAAAAAASISAAPTPTLAGSQHNNMAAMDTVSTISTAPAQQHAVSSVPPTPASELTFGHLASSPPFSTPGSTISFGMPADSPCAASDSGPVPAPDTSAPAFGSPQQPDKVASSPLTGISSHPVADVHSTCSTATPTTGHASFATSSPLADKRQAAPADAVLTPSVPATPATPTPPFTRQPPPIPASAKAFPGLGQLLQETGLRAPAPSPFPEVPASGVHGKWPEQEKRLLAATTPTSAQLAAASPMSDVPSDGGIMLPMNLASDCASSSQPQTQQASTPSASTLAAVSPLSAASTASLKNVVPSATTPCPETMDMVNPAFDHSMPRTAVQVGSKWQQFGSNAAWESEPDATPDRPLQVRRNSVANGTATPVAASRFAPQLAVHEDGSPAPEADKAADKLRAPSAGSTPSPDRHLDDAGSDASSDMLAAAAAVAPADVLLEELTDGDDTPKQGDACGTAGGGKSGSSKWRNKFAFWKSKGARDPSAAETAAVSPVASDQAQSQEKRVKAINALKQSSSRKYRSPSQASDAAPSSPPAATTPSAAAPASVAAAEPARPAELPQAPAHAASLPSSGSASTIQEDSAQPQHGLEEHGATAAGDTALAVPAEQSKHGGGEQASAVGPAAPAAFFALGPASGSSKANAPVELADVQLELDDSSAATSRAAPAPAGVVPPVHDSASGVSKAAHSSEQSGKDTNACCGESLDRAEQSSPPPAVQSASTPAPAATAAVRLVANTDQAGQVAVGEAAMPCKNQVQAAQLPRPAAAYVEAMAELERAAARVRDLYCELRAAVTEQDGQLLLQRGSSSVMEASALPVCKLPVAAGLTAEGNYACTPGALAVDMQACLQSVADSLRCSLSLSDEPGDHSPVAGAPSSPPCQETPPRLGSTSPRGSTEVGSAGRSAAAVTSFREPEPVLPVAAALGPMPIWLDEAFMDALADRIACRVQDKVLPNMACLLRKEQPGA